MAKSVFWRIIFVPNGKNSLKNINNSPKTTGNKAQAIKLMMAALNITIGYVRPTKIFHNITVSLMKIRGISKRVTFPVEIFNEILYLT